MATNPHGGDPARRVHVRSLCHLQLARRHGSKFITSTGASWATVRGQPKMSLSARVMRLSKGGCLGHAEGDAGRGRCQRLRDPRPGCGNL